jgi:long-chain fatty acid transport protein
MGFRHTAVSAGTALALATLAMGAHATNGYFSHGYGIKAKGMGGAGVALHQDAFAGANNPAQAAFAPEGYEVGLDVFSPKRSMSRSMDGMGEVTSATSGKNSFLIPELGYNRRLPNGMGFNLSVYGNGGMNTTYPAGTTGCQGQQGNYMGNALCGMGALGVDLTQLIVAPTLAMEASPGHAVGASLLLVHQQFRAYGLDMFAGMSGAPGQVTNQGMDNSSGVGLRLGYLGQLGDTLSVGASYSPKVGMSRFKRYQKINYSGVRSIGNASASQAPLGSADGAGFGWKDIGVIKLGVQWQASPTLTLRAGYNKGQNPVTGNDVSFNIVAPGVVTDHLTLGATWALDKQSDISVAYTNVKNRSVTGPSMFNGLMPPGTPFISETIRMKQQSIGVQYSRRF